MTQQMDISRRITVVIVTGDLYMINNNLLAASYFISLTEKLRRYGVDTVLRVNGENGIPSADGYIFHGLGERFYYRLPSETKLVSLLFSCFHGVNNPDTQEWLDNSQGSEPPEDIYQLSLDQEISIRNLADKLKTIKNKMFLAGRRQKH